MTTINLEDVVAVQVDEELVCTKCLSAGERDEAGPDDFMTIDDRDRADNKLFFCDRCEKRI